MAGENSGEKYGADLVREIKKLRPTLHFFGIGGKHMAEQQVELIFSIDNLSLVGAVEILHYLPRIYGILNRVKKEIRERSPLAAVLIDSPDFNLRLAPSLYKLSIPVLYYISPTVWAWRKSRLKTINKYVHKMLLIFPFEESIYKKQGIPAVYVGHPLLERIKISLTKEEFFNKYNINPQKKLISLLPGSRKSELKYHLPVLVPSLKKMEREFNSQFLLLKAENLDTPFIYRFLPSSLDIQILDENFYEALASSELALSSCGTANLECALLGTPFISFYRISPLSYHLGINFIKIKNYSIVNILAQKKVVPELIQNKFSPQNILRETKKILESKEVRWKMINNFQRIKHTLGKEKASKKAAEEVVKLILPNQK